MMGKKVCFEFWVCSWNTRNILQNFDYVIEIRRGKIAFEKVWKPFVWNPCNFCSTNFICFGQQHSVKMSLCRIFSPISLARIVKGRLNIRYCSHHPSSTPSKVRTQEEISAWVKKELEHGVWFHWFVNFQIKTDHFTSTAILIYC